MTHINLEMTDTIVQFYQHGRVACEIPLRDIFRAGFNTFEEFCDLQQELGREGYLVREGNGRLEIR